MPQFVYFKDDKGIKHAMPWDKDRDPTDDEIETYLKSDRKVPSPETYAQASGKTRGLTESVLPEYDKNREMPFAERAAKEIGYEGVVRPLFTPLNVAAEGMGLAASSAVAPIANALKSRFPKVTELLTKPRGSADVAESAVPKSKIEPVTDIKGRTVAPPQAEINQRPPGPWDNNAAPSKSQLPGDLRGAKSAFNMGQKRYVPIFDSDLDKAAYIIAKNTPSKRDADYLKFVMDTLKTDEVGARNYGMTVKKHIRDIAKNSDEGFIKIPEYKPPIPNAVKPTTVGPINRTDLANAEAVKLNVMDISKPKVRPGANNTEVHLLNPNKDTVDSLVQRGFSPGQANADGSVTFHRVSPIQSNMTEPMGAMREVSPLSDTASPPVIPSSPNFPPGGGGSDIPPSSPSMPSGNIPPSGRTTSTGEFPSIYRILGVPKALKSGLDLSAFRQGAFLIRRPQFWSTIKPMLQAAKSEQGYQAIADSIIQHPDYPMAKAAGLKFTGLEAGTREEPIMSDLPERIPILGKYYRMSNRAYTAFTNKLRFDVFKSIPMGGNEEAWADYINTATGAGKLSGTIGGGKIPFTNKRLPGYQWNLEPAAQALNAAFFSPRFATSRWKLLNPFNYARMPKPVRQEALKDVATNIMALNSVLGLAYLTRDKTGVSTTLDPTNPDFGKLKFGNTRIDLTNGFGPNVRLIAQLLADHKTSSITGKSVKLNTGKFGAPTKLDVVGNYFGSKESPYPSMVSDILRGQDQVGNKTNLNPLSNPFNNTVIKQFIPMVAQDMEELMQNGDLSNLPVTAAASFTGFPTQTYKATKKKSPFAIK